MISDVDFVLKQLKVVHIWIAFDFDFVQLSSVLVRFIVYMDICSIFCVVQSIFCKILVNGSLFSNPNKLKR